MRNPNFIGRLLAASASVAMVIAPAVNAAEPQSTVATVAAAQAKSETTAELPSETNVILTPTAEVNTKTIKIGDRIELVTVGDVSHNGVVVIPAGTSGYASVLASSGGKAFGRAGEVRFKFESLQFANGKSISLSGIHTEHGARQDTQGANNLAMSGAALAGGFGAIGALAGLLGRAAIKGRAAVIKPGAKLSALTAVSIEYVNNTASEAGIAANPVVAETPTAIRLPVAGSSSTQ